MDLLYSAITLIFFGLTWGFVRMCASLRGGE